MVGPTAARASRAFTVLPAAALLLFVWLAVSTTAVRVVRLPFGADALGFSLSFRIDGLALLFAILISGIGLLIFIYGRAYLAGRRDLTRFFGWLSLFMVAMLGVVTAENLLLLFVFWELTSLSSWFLIGADHERKEAREAALQALLVTGGGGMLMLAGFVMLGAIAGSYELTAILARGDAIRSDALYLPMLLLVLAGAFTKSAQVPFHFWLPSAMQAPTPVSAYLHSATMVKAGVFLLARLLPALAGTSAWMAIVGTAGTITMLTGAVMAIFATDLKKILAYSTVSALGSLTLLLGIGSPAAVQAAIVFLFAHALYKAALFMVGGIVDHETGTRDVERLSGLRRVMPWTAAAAIVGAVSLASFGPVLSFAGKEMVVLAMAGTGRWSVALQAAVYTTSMLLAAAAALVAIRPFFGAPSVSEQVHDPSRSMWLPPLLLAAGGIVLGLLPHGITSLLLAPAAGAVHSEAGAMKVALWHGVNVPLVMAAIATAAGLLLFRTRSAWMVRVRPLARISAAGPEALWNGGLRSALRFAAWQTRVLQNGHLRFYLLFIIATLITLLTVAATTGQIRFRISFHDALLHEIFFSILILAGAFVAVRSRSRLGSVAALGVVGYSVALLYILFSAPDLAMTQFLIETLTVILFVLVIYRLPRFAELTPPAARWRDIVVCTIAGGVIAALVLAGANEPAEPVLSHYYAANSVEQAHGRNIVNVILVDFRALDTLGEITVVAIAAIGVLALLRLRHEGEPR